MRNTQTPLHKVKGLGSSHSGTGHFWRERVSSVALLPLTAWFIYAMLGLINVNFATAANFFALPVNAIFMALFVIITLYHIKLGMQVIIDDYVHAAGAKIALLLLVRFTVIATGAVSLFALLRFVSP